MHAPRPGLTAGSQKSLNPPHRFAQTIGIGGTGKAHMPLGRGALEIEAGVKQARAAYCAGGDCARTARGVAR